MRNLGNTCFASAAVWALWACPSFERELSSKPCLNPFAKTLVTLLRDTASPVWKDFVAGADRLIGRDGSEPHDSHELMCAIIDNTGTEYLFCVQATTFITCGSCGWREKKPETNVFTLCEPGKSMFDGMVAACNTKIVDARKCDKCLATCSAVVQTLPRNPTPPVLVVKVAGVRLLVENTFQFCGNEYVLRAVIIYKGNGSSGHYTCAVRSTEGKWRICDDDSVSDMDVREKAGASYIINPNTVLYERA